MKRTLRAYCISALLGLLLSGAGIAQPSSGGVSWLELDDAVFVKSKEIYTPVLLFVTAGWCKFCQDMNEKTFHDPAIVKYVKTNFISVTASADDISLVKRYNITALPAIIVLDSQGTVIDEFSGYRDVDYTMKVLMHAYRQYQMG